MEEISLNQASIIIKSVLNIYEAQPEDMKEGLPSIKEINVDFTTQQPEDIIENIAKTITILNEFYYKHDEPLVEDDLYDTLREDYLEKLAPNHEILKKVGETIKENEELEADFFPTSKHEIVAGSQSKVKNSEKEKFNEKMDNLGNAKITISDKMDGITVVITYTSNKEKAFEYLSDLFEHHLKYIENSKKSKKEKDKIINYIEEQKKKYFEKIKSVIEGNYFPYKIITRGDGIIGEDITLNAIDMKGIVFEILKEEISSNDKEELIVRSEAVIKITDFEGLPYKNPRNGVATIRNQNGQYRDKITAIPFEKILHNIETEELINFNRDEMFEWYKNQGFETPYYETIEKKEDILKTIEKRLKERENKQIEYWTDGIILSVTDKELRKNLGMVGKKPKGEFAFKPDPERAIGIIESIEFTVGKTGNITPVAKFKEKVLISGSEVISVSLANEEIMKEIAPFKGALVEVVKRGEIIPKIEKNIDLEPINTKLEDFVINKLLFHLTKKEQEQITKLYQTGEISKIFNKNIKDNFKESLNLFFEYIVSYDKYYDKLLTKTSFKKEWDNLVNSLKPQAEQIIKAINKNSINYPKSCPSCGTELEKGKILVKCPSKNCREKHIAQLNFFAQKLTKEIGEGKITQLYDKGILKTYSDFFKITEEDFKENGEFIEGWQTSSVNNFIKSVNGIKKSKDNEFFSSLFFENIGEDKFLKLFQKYSFNDLRKELDIIEKKIPEEFEEIKTIEKFLSELEKINYYNMDIVRKIASVEGWGSIGIVRLINLWVEEKEALNDLLKEITIEETEIVQISGEELKVVITGSVDYIPEYIEEAKGKSNRDKLKNYIKGLGYKSPGSVSDSTTCLVSDTVSTSGKFKDASDKGIPILTSKEFFEKYGEILNKTISKQTNVNTKNLTTKN